jgi:hypothetical protein
VGGAGAVSSSRVRGRPPSNGRSPNGDGHGDRRAARRAGRHVQPDVFVAPRPRGLLDAVTWFRLGPSDRPLVAAGDEVTVDQPLIDRGRDVSIAEVRVARGTPLPEPGSWYGTPSPEGPRGRVARAPAGVVLFHTPDGRIRLAVARYRDTVASPIRGTVESVDAGAIAVRAAGFAVPGSVAWGQAVSGPLRSAVPDPDAELRSSAVDVGAAGAILLAGARLDIEALTRARAIGVRGIITGGLIGKELRQLEASDARQRASLSAASPFGLVVLDGYGRRPIPEAQWRILQASAGQQVALLMDPPMVVLDGEPEATPSAGVRVAAGEALGDEAALLGLAGPVRQRAGLYQSSAIIGVDRSDETGDVEWLAVPTADLERFE